jgi:hypothetical protein
MQPWLALAAAIAFAIFVIHTFAGGRFVARPLLAASGLHPVPKITAYYCWHITTIVLFAMGVVLLYAAVVPNPALVWLIWSLALAFALLNLGLAFRYRLRPSRLPQWMMFAALAASIAPALQLA